MAGKKHDIDEIIAAFNNHDRRALSTVITYIESDQEEHGEIVDKILTGISKPQGDAIVVAVSGPPGVGKSTFINALGKIIIDSNYRLAVLAIDPSSEVSGGSILADKTRMTHLVKSPNVFIRPTPARGTLGGITLTSKDVLYALTSFGFNFIMIETVGVGQSETLAKALADHFVVLMQPGAGDELQGMKKGILETADFILVNKADGEQENLALQSERFLKSAQPQTVGHRGPYIDVVSAQSGRGLALVFAQVQKEHERMRSDGTLELKRRRGLAKIVEISFEHRLIRHVRQKSGWSKKIHVLVDEIAKTGGAVAPGLNRLVQEVIGGAL